MTKLKPCPFCKFKKIYIEPIIEWKISMTGQTKKRTVIGWEFYCGSFNTWPPTKLLKKQHCVQILISSRKDAVKFWNTRKKGG